jgi:DNA-directed RNA polymerase subunit M
MGWGTLEFCPKCEGLLMPKKQKSKTVFYCPHCGFEQKPKKKTENDYKVVWKIEHTPKDEIIVVEGKKRGKKDKELMKEEMEDYYRSMLDFYPEEGD